MMQLPPCVAVTDSLRSADTARIAGGEYILVVVSREGRAQGKLVLRPTSARDRSPQYPQIVPRAGDTTEFPLYGWTNIDLPSIDLPIGADTGRFWVPAPSSRDPIYPGVLVLDGTALVIGTFSNRRDHFDAEDGSGIVLRVRQFNHNGFAGTVGPWGIVRFGPGYFCAFRALNHSP